MSLVTSSINEEPLHKLSGVLYRLNGDILEIAHCSLAHKRPFGKIEGAPYSADELNIFSDRVEISDEGDEDLDEDDYSESLLYPEDYTSIVKIELDKHNNLITNLLFERPD